MVTVISRGASLRIYIALLLTAVVSSAGVTVIYSVLPTLYRHFPDSPYVGWVVTTYWLGAAVAAAVCGRLGDLLGYRRVLLSVLVLCSGGAIISALAPNLAVLILGCAIQAIASAILPLSMGLVRENLPVKEIPFAVGILGAAGMVAAGLIYVSSGMVIDHFSWQGGFWFKIVLSTFAFIAVITWIPRSTPRPGTSIDFVRGLAFAPAICLILFAIQNVRHWGLGDQRILASLGAGILILALWGRHQWRQSAPLINVRMLGQRQILLANVCMALLALGGMQLGQIFSLLLQQPTWTQVGFGLSATQAGLTMLSGNIASLVASPWSGRIAVRHGARPAVLVGMAVMVASWGAVMLQHDSRGILMLGILMCSAGLAFAYTGIYNLIIEATPRERTGEATGMSYVVFSCFFAVGAQAVFAVLGRSSVSNGLISFPDESSFVATFGYVSIMAAIGFCIALLMPKRRAADAAAVVAT
jgi:MFS family permease